MKKISLVWLILVPCFSGLSFSGIRNLSADDVGRIEYNLIKQWETKKELRVPESVLYDESENILYVSNIKGRSTEKNGQGNYFISDWKGKTSLVTASGQVIVLIDTTSSKINSADLEYIKAKRLLLIPTFFDNRVMAYKVKNVGGAAK